MTEHPNDTETGRAVGIPDEALPDDLVPGEDNPLAEGLPPGESAEGLLDSDSEDDPEKEAPERGRQTGSAPQEQ